MPNGEYARSGELSWDPKYNRFRRQAVERGTLPPGSLDFNGFFERPDESQCVDQEVLRLLRRGVPLASAPKPSQRDGLTIYVPRDDDTDKYNLGFVRQAGLDTILQDLALGGFDPKKPRELSQRIALVKVSGSDVARRVAEDLDSEFQVFGVTTEDYKLYSCNLSPQMLDLCRRGAYADAVFGLPALCLLGLGGMTGMALRSYGERGEIGVIPDIPADFWRFLEAKAPLLVPADYQYIFLERFRERFPDISPPPIVATSDPISETLAAFPSCYRYGVDIVLYQTTFAKDIGVIGLLATSTGYLLMNRAGKDLQFACRRSRVH